MGGRRWRGPTALVGLGVLMVATAACGKDSSSADATTTTGASSTTTTAAPTSTTSTSVKASGDVTLTADSFGVLHLGMTNEEALATGVVNGPFSSGCEVASPPPMGASLKAPLDGEVSGAEGHITNFAIRSGYVTDPGGIRKGDPLAKVQSALGATYDVQVDKSQADVFDIWFVNVLDHGKQLFAFSVDPKTQLVGDVGVPYILTCD